MISGYVKRCYISFVDLYSKVKKHFEEINKSNKIYDLDKKAYIELARKIAEIAKNYDIKVFACCTDYLVGGLIGKASCIDIDLINDIFFDNVRLHSVPFKPTRKECGCFQSSDIGTYDTCIHGCNYCYANMNKKSAQNRYNKHEPHSAFLGFSKDESDLWLKELDHEV